MNEHQRSDLRNAKSDLPASAKLSAEKSKMPDPAKRAGRSVWQTYVLRLVILLMAVAAFAEFWAQSRFRHNLKICQEALDRTEDKSGGETTKTTYEQLKSQLSATPTYTEGVHQFAKCGIYTWNFQGVRHYTVRLYVNPQDQTVYDVESEPAAQ